MLELSYIYIYNIDYIAAVPFFGLYGAMHIYFTYLHT